jgi:hypothetical protein
MIEYEELKALKVNPRSPVTSTEIQQPSSEEEETITPSASITRPQLFNRTLRNYHGYVEAPRRSFRESRPPKKFPYYMELVRSIIYSKPSSF